MRFILLTLILLALPAVAPAAEAHTCQSSDPARDCGECRSGAHDHRYGNGTTYCSNVPSPYYVCVDVSGWRKVCVSVESIAPVVDLPRVLDVTLPYDARLPADHELARLA